MTISAPLCSIGIAALLPLSCLAGEVFFSAPTTPAKTTNKYLFVAAVQEKVGKCITQELRLNESEDVAGSLYEAKHARREGARPKGDPNKTLSDFRAVSTSDWAFVFSYKTRPDKCTNTHIGIETGATEAEARGKMEEQIRKMKGTEVKEIRKWPRPEDKR